MTEKFKYSHLCILRYPTVHRHLHGAVHIHPDLLGCPSRVRLHIRTPRVCSVLSLGRHDTRKYPPSLYMLIRNGQLTVFHILAVHVLFYLFMYFI